MARFDGKVALITGAAHGIGAATAARLHAEGAQVAIADIDEPAALRQAAGLDALAVRCDVTDRASVRATVDAVIERHGRLDVLVNNVGSSTDTHFEDVDDDEWHLIVDRSLNGAVRCIQAAMPHLLRTKGNVVSIGSVNGLAAFFGEVPYATAKAGLVSLTRTLAASYGKRGVRLNVVAPGTIRTRVWDDEPGALDTLATLYPLGRVGEPEDIAAAVAFLASPDASWITGITLPVDGGILTGPAAIVGGEQGVPIL